MSLSSGKLSDPLTNSDLRDFWSLVFVLVRVSRSVR